MIRGLTRCLVCLGVILLTHSASFGQFYNLGPQNAISGLSYDGSVGTGTDAAQYFLWSPQGGVQPIGGISPGNGIGGEAEISHDGTKVSGSALYPATGQYEMSLYDTNTGGWSSLGGIGGVCPGGPGDEVSAGWGISGDGTSVVGLGWTGICGPAHGIQWKNSTGITTDLGSTVPGNSSRANGVNTDGSVVVGWQDDVTGFRQAAVWTNGVQTLLTNASGEQLSEAADVSGDGNWVVGDGGFGSLDQGWRWSAATGMEPLGSLIQGGFFPRGAATAISDDGNVIVGYEREFGQFPTGGTGFIWTAASGIVSLNDYLDSLGIDRGGFNASLPLSISGDGRTIGGAGIAPGSFFGGEGFVVTIPEPTPMLAAAFFLGTIAGLRSKSRKS